MKLKMWNGAEILIGDIERYQGNDNPRMIVELTAEEEAICDEVFGTSDIGEDCE